MSRLVVQFKTSTAAEEENLVMKKAPLLRLGEGERFRDRKLQGYGYEFGALMRSVLQIHF